MKRKGIFIVLDGPDGSGKATQCKLLLSRLRGLKKPLAFIDFPQYGHKSAGPVEEYLNGKYGKSDNVTPQIASIFYAVDRYDASFKIRKWVEEGRVVIADRYVFANIGHQGAKIVSLKEWTEYVSWLFELEFGFFGIPKPDRVIILNNSSKLSNSLSKNVTDKSKIKKKQLYLGHEKQDIHEKDLDHLKRAHESYIRLLKYAPKLCREVVVSADDSRMRAKSDIHDDIWRIVSKIL